MITAIARPGVGSKYFLKKNLQKISEKREKKFNIHCRGTVALLQFLKIVYWFILF